jgi:Exo-beta-D-glucosaminidase Ig-fold domain
MYEGRNAQLFHPATAILTWMSNPAQPSFVWQLYHYDLEPMSSYFAVMHAAELAHIQFNEASGHVEVINNRPDPLADAVAHVAVYNLDGTLAYENRTGLTDPPDTAADLGPIDFPPGLSAVHFIQLELSDAKGELISSNFYWRALPAQPGNHAAPQSEVRLSGQYEDLTALNQLPAVALHARLDSKSPHQLALTFENPSSSFAVMAHVQLRRHSGERILPVYYSDNYFSLAPKEKKSITIEAPEEDFEQNQETIAVDGWNVSVAPFTFDGIDVTPNLEAQPDHSPETGLPVATTGLR